MMKVLATLTASALLAAICTPSWAVYKCAGAAGKVTFQDAPCVQALPSADAARPAASQPVSQPPSEADEAAANRKRADDIDEAIRLHRPMVGMTLSQLTDAMGQATGVHSTEVEGVSRQQLIYERVSGTWYVYPFDGVVKSVHHQPPAR
ncbi:MAG: DUF4124 domain-containing protein [Burkholderiales bacterium]